MICPYLKRKFIGKKLYKGDLNSDNVTIDVVETFDDCLGDRCPFYDRKYSRCKRVEISTERYIPRRNE